VPADAADDGDTAVDGVTDNGPDDGTAATRREGHGIRKSGGSRPAPDRDDEERLAPGTQIGRYVVIDVLGAGGMGVVYSAFDPELDRKVAIKLLQARAGGSESGGQTWLLREAQAMARLAHPNVVAVHDVGAISNDRVFVAMELVEGMTLRAWLKGKHGWRAVLHVMRAAGAGLAAAHAAGLVHRDFKPDNVLVGNDGRARVMDFGLARLRVDDGLARRRPDVESKSPLSERLTVTGAVLGTPAYMAPEIYRGHAADARGDQFAFGVALYEALYRKRPFARQDLVDGHAVVPRPPADAKVPAWVERIVLRAIALDPDGRFGSIDELLAKLADDPTARRRRIVLGAGIALACGGAIAGAFALRGTESASVPCTDAASRLAGAWDAGTRSALEAAFHKGHKAYADDALRGTETALDTYAAGWVDMHTETCRATRVHGYQSEEVLTLRMECLDDRLVELRTLVHLFGEADDTLVLGAVTAAHKLGSLADCADIPALLVPDRLPTDPVARLQVKAQQAKLAEARTLYHAGRPADTLALTTAIAPEVTRLGHLPTEAVLHLLSGQTRWVLEGADKGEPELMKAAFAAEAGKADETKVEAWLQLTNLATEGSRFDLARERWQHASAALARLGSDWELKVRVLASKALLDSHQNMYDEAVATAKQARSVADQHPRTQTYGYALLVEASILTASGHSKEAIEDFRKVLAYQESLGHRRIEVATTLQTMAAAELALGRPDDTLTHAKAALDIDQAIYGRDNPIVARGISVIGAAQGMKGDLEAALASDRQALEIAARTVGEQDDLYAMILGQVASTLVDLKRPKEAIPYLDRAAKIQTAKLGAGHVQTLVIMQTTCDALHAAGKLKEALATCRRTLATAEKSLGKTSPMLFVFLGHTGIVLLDAKQPRDASAMFERALRLGASDPSDLYYIAMLDARALWAAGNKKRAVELARKARDGFTELGKDHADQAKEAAAWLTEHGG